MIRTLVLSAALWASAGVSAGPAAGASPDLALILCGNDNTLSTVDLPGGPSHLARATFASFPGNAVIESGRYYAAVSGADHVVVFDAATLVPLDTLETGAGTNPFYVAGDGAGNVTVTLFNTGEAVRFDADGAETGRTAVGRSPQGVAFHEGRWYVANTGFRPSDFGYDPGTVSVLDPATFTVTDTVPVGLNPQNLAGASGEIHVVCSGDFVSTFGEIHILSTAGSPLDTLALGGSPANLAVGGGIGCTADYFGGIYVYDAVTRAVLHDAASPVAFGGTGYTGLALDGEDHLYVTLYGDDLCARLRLPDFTVDATFATGGGPGSIVLRREQPVPVRLLHLSATVDAGAAVVRWSMADADGVAAFLIERSPGGASWTQAGRTGAAATSFVDADAALRYRLSAVLRDGSPVRLGVADAAGPEDASNLALRVLANPVRDALPISAEGGRAPVTVRVHDVRGALVLERTIGHGVAALPLAGVPAGVYFVTAPGAGSPPAKVVVAR
jgi:YVTN family beta-propeller protein